MHASAAHRVTAGEPAPPGVVERLMLLAALVGLLSSTWRRCRGVHRRRMAGRPDGKPDKLQVWEGEGGQNQMPDAPQ